MSKKGKKGGSGIVYSTSNADYDDDYDDEDDTLAPKDQLLYISIDRKQRKGKEVTLVEGFVGAEEDLSALAKMLKSKCGVGGNAKDGQIIIQGNKRDKVIELLEKDQYRCKRKGG